MDSTRRSSEFPNSSRTSPYAQDYPPMRHAMFVPSIYDHHLNGVTNIQNPVGRLVCPHSVSPRPNSRIINDPQIIAQYSGLLRPGNSVVVEHGPNGREIVARIQEVHFGSSTQHMMAGQAQDSHAITFSDQPSHHSLHHNSPHRRHNCLEYSGAYVCGCLGASCIVCVASLPLALLITAVIAGPIIIILAVSGVIH